MKKSFFVHFTCLFRLASEAFRPIYETMQIKEKLKDHFINEVVLYQISNYLSSQAVSNQVLSAYAGLTAVFEMGTGGSPQLSSLNLRESLLLSQNYTEEEELLNRS